jgi:hypothetical protein
LNSVCLDSIGEVVERAHAEERVKVVVDVVNPGKEEKEEAAQTQHHPPQQHHPARHSLPVKSIEIKVSAKGRG